MFAYIVKRNGKRALWITYKERSERPLRDYLSDLGRIDELAFLRAVTDVAIDQVEPYETMDDVAKHVRMAYVYYTRRCL